MYLIRCSRNERRRKYLILKYFIYPVKSDGIQWNPKNNSMGCKG